MAFNSGQFLRLFSWVTDAANGINITDTRMDSEFDGIATALSSCMLKDGTQTVTANIPMATFKFTGLGSGSARTDSANIGQVQDGLLNWVDGGGAADAITAAYSPAITALVDGQVCHVRATAANATTTPTFSPSTLTPRTIVKNGGLALAIGDIAGDGHELILKHDLSNARWELLNPKSGRGDMIGANNLSDVANAATARSNIGAGTVTGVTAGNASVTVAGTASAPTVAVNLGNANTWTAAQGCSNNILTDGSTITPDLSGPNEGWVILGGDRTLGIPANMVAGKRQRFAWDILQDETGSRALAYAWCYSWAGGTAGTLSATALFRDKIFGDVAYYATSTATITIATPGVVSWTAHGLRTGDKLQITTTGDLPTGLSASTTYFAIKNDADSFWLATSLTNAAAGTKIATSGSQSGTHTIVACAIDLSLNKAFA